MKKQRKIISIFLAFMMIIATGAIMAGCGEDDVDPVELFDKASENMNKADTLSFDMEMKMITKIAQQSMDITIGADCDYIKPTKDDCSDMQMSAKMNMELMNQKVQTEIYVKDSVVYTNAEGQKIKTEIPKNEIKDINRLFDDKDMIKIDNYVKESKIEGDKITLKVDGQKLIDAFLKKYSNLLNGDSSSLNMAGGLTDQLKNSGIETVDIEAVVKDENFTSLKCDIPMKMDGAMYGQKDPIEADINLTLKTIEVNQDLKDIEVPDADQYKTSN